MATIKDLLGDKYNEEMTINDIMEIEIENDDDLETLKKELAKAKLSVSKANSEAADYKKQLRAKMSEDEAAKLQRDEEYAELKSKYEALEKANKISSYEAEYRALGYDDKMVKETAQALYDGDYAKVLANQKAFNESLEKKIKADVLASTPKPQGGVNKSEQITKEQFDKMGYAEALKNENPELYDTLMESE